MGPIVVDTNVVLYHLQGQLADPIIGGETCVSVITEIELLGFSGLTEATELPIREFLSLSRCIEINNDVKEEAIRLRRTTRLKIADAIIAATAIIANAELLTHDSALLTLPEVNARAPRLK